MRRSWLIAEREFRTYATTATFWIACLLGPIILLVLAVAVHFGGAAQVAVVSRDPRLGQLAVLAVREASAAEGREVEFAPRGSKVTVFRAAGGDASMAFDQGFPLSPAARLLALRTLERDEARAAAGLPRPRPTSAAGRSFPDQLDPQSQGRFAVMLMLWLALTGSLGMLLQAVVRERTNRALEILLSALEPRELVVGKALGVGLVSALVIGVWLAAAALAALFGGDSSGSAAAALRAMGSPSLLATAAIAYVLAFAFYGLATVGIGALARDNTAAQNLARPMFVLLLVAFFLARFTGGGSADHGLPWLAYVPPLTPFMVLMRPASGAELTGALTLLAGSAVIAGLWASSVVAQSFASRPSR